jgi:hypothetical protein
MKVYTEIKDDNHGKLIATYKRGDVDFRASIPFYKDDDNNNVAFIVNTKFFDSFVEFLNEETKTNEEIETEKVN